MASRLTLPKPCRELAQPSAWGRIPTLVDVCVIARAKPIGSESDRAWGGEVTHKASRAVVSLTGACGTKLGHYRGVDHSMSHFLH